MDIFTKLRPIDHSTCLEEIPKFTTPYTNLKMLVINSIKILQTVS